MTDLINQTPGQLAEYRLVLSDTYSKAGELKVKLLRKRAEYYQENRPSHKSDASVERAWETTTEGLDLIELGMKLKSIEVKMSAIKSLLDTRNFEARNSY